MKCKLCDKPTSGKSQYCKEHKKIAREKWLEKINEQKQERQNRYMRFAEIWENAVAAGQKALEECTPTPMVVQQHTNPLDDSSPVSKSWYVSGGVCGFAWVNVSPGNTSFARWLVKQGYAGKSYRGGVDIWVRAGGQSLERKEAYAHAMAASLKKHRDQLKCSFYVLSRLD